MDDLEDSSMKAINRLIDRKTERQKDIKTQRQKERKTKRQKNRKTERQKDRQTKVSNNAYTILMIPNMTSMIEKIPSM